MGEEVQKQEKEIEYVIRSHPDNQAVIYWNWRTTRLTMELTPGAMLTFTSLKGYDYTCNMASPNGYDILSIDPESIEPEKVEIYGNGTPYLRIRMLPDNNESINLIIRITVDKEAPYASPSVQTINGKQVIMGAGKGCSSCGGSKKVK